MAPRCATWRSVVLALIAAGAVVACERGNGPVGLGERDALTQQIVNMGFRPDMIVEHENYFVVEGDILIQKADLLRRMGGAGRTTGEPGVPPIQPQYVTNIQVSTSKISYIYVNIDATVNSAWATATRSAISEWNAISSTAIRFVEMAPADLVVSTGGEILYDPIAQSSFPLAGGAPGPTITIDASHAEWGSTSQKKFVMVHEFGHNTGFRHTNLVSLGEGLLPWGANLISGTPPTDAVSVMNGNTGGTLWSGFSYYDQVAARSLYPAPPAPYVASVSTSPSPARQYLPFTVTVNGSGFDTVDPQVLYTRQGCDPRWGSCTGVYSAPQGIFAVKTPTQLVFNMAFSITGTYDIQVRSGPKGGPSQPPRSFTVLSYY